jgi:hypothetical protein
VPVLPLTSTAQITASVTATVRATAIQYIGQFGLGRPGARRRRSRRAATGRLGPRIRSRSGITPPSASRAKADSLAANRGSASASPSSICASACLSCWFRLNLITWRSG